MRLSRLLATIVAVFAVLLGSAKGQQQIQSQQITQAIMVPKCTYTGTWGTFVLNGGHGSAAYQFRDTWNVGEVTYRGQDETWWYYAPIDGHPAITMWSISRIPDCYGRYAVWRQADGIWATYDMMTKRGGLGPLNTWRQTICEGGVDVGTFEQLDREVKKHTKQLIEHKQRLDKLDPSSVIP